ncbi:conserved hypothetical protein [Methanococcus vannielii SB]|uniref:O-antigen polymerase n=1 Tax=Methanococcus vannielii (strain ATCC 35089 / DSM 1224 / JCM 13029 / OCM 148 / SB) TaxID=406327 RepID=A6UPC0_METVS|nr:hypothetical protein [Methanococcus vannielii]ABR54342.1 conserved hypothetical protein [Methanococcus vannielii SB]
MLKNKFNNLALKIDSKFHFELDNPVVIISLGHLFLFVLAIPYYGEFGLNSLFKMFLFVFGNIFVFSIPFLFNNLKIGKLEKLDLKLISWILVILTTFYGIFLLSNSIIFTIIILGIVVIILEIFIKYYNSKDIGKITLSIGVFSFIILVLTTGKIPILDYGVRMSISNDPLRLISSGALIFASFFNFWYFLISFVLITLTGYKANVIGLVSAYLLYKYRLKKIGAVKIFFIGLVSLLFLGLMSKIILASSGQIWTLNFIEILSYRAYFDLMTLNKILSVPQVFFGKIVFMPGGESQIGNIIYGYTHNITSTMFGPLYLEMGYFGLIFTLIFGIISKLIYKKSDTKIYAIYGAVLLSMCEIGINYGFLVVMLMFLYVSESLSKKSEISA